MTGDSGIVIFGYLDGNHVALGRKDMSIFRPIRSEEERKRDKVLQALRVCLGHTSGMFDLMLIYDAIAAGPPHVKIV